MLDKYVYGNEKFTATPRELPDRLRNVCVWQKDPRTIPIVCVFIKHFRSILCYRSQYSSLFMTGECDSNNATTNICFFFLRFHFFLYFGKQKYWCCNKKNLRTHKVNEKKETREKQLWDEFADEDLVFVSTKTCTHGYNNTNKPNRHISEPSPNIMAYSRRRSLRRSALFFPVVVSFLCAVKLYHDSIVMYLFKLFESLSVFPLRQNRTNNERKKTEFSAYLFFWLQNNCLIIIFRLFIIFIRLHLVDKLRSKYSLNDITKNIQQQIHVALRFFINFDSGDSNH